MIQIFNAFEFTDGDEKKLSNVLEQFDAYCSPKKNEVYKRHVFRCRVQQQDESFDSYVTELRLKVKSCNYGDMQSSMLRDQIVFGIHNKKVRERLLREDSLTLEDAIRMCRASERTEKQMKIFEKPLVATEAPVGVDRVVRARTPHSEGERLSNAREAGSDYLMNCRRCGGKHRFRQCPAYGKVCLKCRGKNNFAKVCLSASENKQINMMEESEGINGIKKINADKWIVPLPVNGTEIHMKLDTGAMANLITLKDFKALHHKPVIKNTQKWD